MSDFSISQINDKWILSKRGEKNTVDPLKPYGYFVEKERTLSGTIEDVATILLTNSECPFRCLMCDLWKNTTDKPVPANSIPAQIEFALSKLPKTKHLKLYNSGSFFDTRAIPETDYKNIAGLIDNFETVIVESHPSFINEKVLLFNDLIKPKLQVALGLETIHPEVLPLLNKKMTLADFEKSVRFLNSNRIESRAFILLRPPFLSEEEGVFSFVSRFGYDPTFVEQKSFANDLHIYPNPATTYFTLHQEATSVLDIYNMQGQNVLQQALNAGSNRVDVSALPHGLYFTVVSGSNQYQSGKMIKR